jgi:hypothetical protein
VPTPSECWHRAEALVKLAALATQLYAREMLLERAAEFRRTATHRPASLVSFRSRQVNTKLAEIPCRRATSETFAPGASVSSKMRALSSRDHRRRRSTPLRTSTRIARP